VINPFVVVLESGAGALSELGVLVAGLSPWKSGFKPRSLHEEYVERKVSLVLSPGTSIFLFQRHSTNGLYSP
jgi:hypothetical protein